MEQGRRETGVRARPHPLFVIFFPIRQYAGIAVFTLCIWLVVMLFRWAGFSDVGVRAGSALLVGVVAMVARVVWAVLQWAVRVYGVEERAGETPVVYSVVGVLNRTRSEIGIDGLRNVVVDRPFVQRLFGLGSVGFATAGTGGYEVVWRIVGDPQKCADRIRVLGRPRGVAGEPAGDTGPEKAPAEIFEDGCGAADG